MFPYLLNNPSSLVPTGKGINANWDIASGDVIVAVTQARGNHFDEQLAGAGRIKLHFHDFPFFCRGFYWRIPNDCCSGSHDKLPLRRCGRSTLPRL
jgi:hypothetical protein